MSIDCMETLKENKISKEHIRVGNTSTYIIRKRLNLYFQTEYYNADEKGSSIGIPLLILLDNLKNNRFHKTTQI